MCVCTRLHILTLAGVYGYAHSPIRSRNFLANKNYTRNPYSGTVCPFSACTAIVGKENTVTELRPQDSHDRLFHKISEAMDIQPRSYLLLCLLWLCILPLVGTEGCVQSIDHPVNCISIYLCRPILDLLIQFGESAGDYLRSRVCGLKGNVALVCCPVQPAATSSFEQLQITPQLKKSPNAYQLLFQPDCGLGHKQPNKKVNDYTSTTQYRSRRQTAPALVGGINADVGDWPWMTILGYKSLSEMPTWKCGGSLISRRHVLTAAHCVYQHSDLYLVRLGDLCLDNTINDNAAPVDVEIERATFHPQFNSTTYINDIAVLKLTRDIEFSANISPICLPLRDGIRTKDLNSELATIAGWGATYFHGLNEMALQSVETPVVNNDHCKRAYKWSIIEHRVMCAGYANGNKNACHGDSGGPLMYFWQGAYYAVGIVSYAYRCAQPGYPEVFAKVSEYLDFILQHLN